MLGVRAVSGGLLDSLSDLESRVRHGLADLDSNIREGAQQFESRNREWIQATVEGAACVVGASYLGPQGGMLICMPFAQRLAGSPGQLVDPNSATDPRAAAARAYEAGDPGWVGLDPLGKTSNTEKGLLLALLLAFAWALA